MPGEGPETKQTALTRRARRLYEETAVPVAEIARLCGVTERTLYKYARKGGWKPRYAWVDFRIDARNDARDDAGGRARRRRPGDAAFAPVKGAGARFVKRADKGKPVAAGLKATDALSAARAATDCAAAETMGREALAEAAWTRWDETFRVWLKTADSLRAALAAHRARRRKRANGARRARDAEPDAYEQWLERAGHMACDALEYCQAQSARCGFVEILAAGAVTQTG